MEERVVENAYRPDMVIVEDGVGRPKLELKELIGEESSDSNLTELMFTKANIPTANIRFHLYPNDIASPFLACGSAATFPSFF